MLDTYIEEVQRRRKRFVVYSPDETDLPDRLATRNVTVEHRSLPGTGPSAFVTVHDGEEFLGAVSLERFRELLAPPVVRVGEQEGLTEAYRALLDVLEETMCQQSVS